MIKNLYNSNLFSFIYINCLGEKILSHYTENHSHDSQNLTVTIEYPKPNDIGEKLTFVHLLVFQRKGSNGTAVITDGGIRERKITILVSGYNTNILNYNITFYGLWENK